MRQRAPSRWRASTGCRPRSRRRDPACVQLLLRLERHSDAGERIARAGRGKHNAHAHGSGVCQRQRATNRRGLQRPRVSCGLALCHEHHVHDARLPNAPLTSPIGPASLLKQGGAARGWRPAGRGLWAHGLRLRPRSWWHIWRSDASRADPLFPARSMCHRAATPHRAETSSSRRPEHRHHPWTRRRHGYGIGCGGVRPPSWRRVQADPSLMR